MNTDCYDTCELATSEYIDSAIMERWNETKNIDEFVNSFAPHEVVAIACNLSHRNDSEFFTSFDDNVLDVTPTFLISLGATIGLLRQKGIKYINVPKELPLRLQVHRRFDDEKRRIVDNNTTKKFIRLFKRLDKHLVGISIDDRDMSYLRIEIRDVPNKNVINNSILDEISNLMIRTAECQARESEAIEK